MIAYKVFVSTKEVKRIANMNYSRYRPMATFVKGLPAVIGGTGSNHIELNTVEVLQDNQWIQIANLNVARCNHACGFIGEFTYVFGGQDRRGSTIDSIEKFSNDVWKLISIKLPFSAWGIGSCKITHNSLLLIGGFRFSASSEVYEWNEEKCIKRQSLNRPAGFLNCNSWIVGDNMISGFGATDQGFSRQEVFHYTLYS